MENRRDGGAWSAIVAEQAKSGLSARAYCQERGIGLWSFYQQRSRLRKCAAAGDGRKKTVSPFIEVREAMPCVSPSAAEPGWQIVLELGEGMRLTLRRS
mgnify:CR=1 FL=1